MSAAVAPLIFIHAPLTLLTHPQEDDVEEQTLQQDPADESDGEAPPSARAAKNIAAILAASDDEVGRRPFAA